MNARRLASAAVLAVVLCVSAPGAFADTQQPWNMPGTDNCSLLLDAAVAGVEAALTVL